MQKARTGDPRAQYVIGLKYLLGQGLPQSLNEGSRWIQLSAHAKVAEAMIALAALYDVGVTVPFDSAQATRLRAQAARAGNRFAATQLHEDSTMRGHRDFRRAQSLTDFKMYALALKYARKAADAGSASGQLLLGRAYHFALGVPVDHAAALALYVKSSAGGLADGSRAVGYMHEFGLGVPVNRAEALRYYDLAAQRGSEIAKVNARFLRSPDYDRSAQARSGSSGAGSADLEFQRFQCVGAGGQFNGSSCLERNTNTVIRP
jgi:TPR repeat protein